MALPRRDGATTFIPIHGTDEIADVTGAGDTVISTFTRPWRAARRRSSGRPGEHRGRHRGDEARHRGRCSVGAQQAIALHDS